MSCQVCTNRNVLDKHKIRRKKFYNYIVKNNPYNYPKNEKDCYRITTGFINNDVGIIRKYSFFEIVVKRGRKILAVKEDESNKHYNIILLQEAYDIIEEAHLLNLKHNRKSNMWNYIRKDYIIPYDWISYFFDTCEVCSVNLNEQHPISSRVPLRNESNPESTYLSAVEICISTFIKSTDSNFTQVLLYVDSASHYTIVRPLMTDSADELAFELFKIFTDFVPPKKIGCDNMKSKLNSVLAILIKLNLPFELPEICCSSNSNVVALSIANILQKEMYSLDEIESQNWVTTIRELQWKINLQKNGMIESRFMEQCYLKSQFHAFFGVDNKDLSTTENFEEHPNRMCSECQNPIYKVYVCETCKKSVHFTCCQRKVILCRTIYGIYTKRMIATCLSCTNKTVVSIESAD